MAGDRDGVGGGSETGPASERVTVRRAAHKAAYDRATIDAILDATPFCHLGYIHDGHPVVIPTLQVRVDDHLYLHGSTGSRLGLQAGQPWPVCVTVTLVDALVLARSGFHHSINHRSVVVIGDAVLVPDHDERLAALEALTNAVAPGRWDELRAPTRRELAATSVARLPLTEASAKIRTGPPIDEPEDVRSDTWAGLVPVRTTFGEAEPAPDLPADVALPPSVRRLLDSE